jgi:hypothetical protein
MGEGTDAPDALDDQRRDIDALISQYHDLDDLSNGKLADKGYSDVTMYCDRSLGALRDLHVDVLEPLLEKKPDCPTMLRKLARLHSLLRNYERSQHLWERYTQITKGEHIANMKTYKHDDFYDDKLVRTPRFRNDFGQNHDEWGYSTGDLGAGSNRVGGYSVDATYDRIADASRRDYTDFRSGDMSKIHTKQVSGGKHIGATTIFYTTPPGGWNDDDTPMRNNKGGMRSALSSGLSKVENEMKKVGGNLLYGYEVEGGSVREQKDLKGILRATVNENNSDIGLAGLGGDDEQPSGDDGTTTTTATTATAMYGHLRDPTDGTLALPLRLQTDTSKVHAPAPPVWKKGGALPPRLYSEHDFRVMAGSCDLAHPDEAAKKASFSVFSQEYTDLPPLVRYRHNGSALTLHEQQRLERIEAMPGKFGAVPEKNIIAEPTQTFAGRSSKPTAAMMKMYMKAQGGAEEKKKKLKEKQDLAKKKEAEEARKRGEKLRLEIERKKKFKLERKFTVGLGGKRDLIPVPMRREGGRTEAQILAEMPSENSSEENDNDGGENDGGVE